MTTETLESLAEAVATVSRLWPSTGVEGTAGPQLVQLAESAGAVLRLAGAVVAQLAAEVDRQSRPELGPESLAKQHRCRSAAAFLATVLGTTHGEAARFVQVGTATVPRLMLTGEDLPALYPHVGRALAAGRIGKDAAAAIISMLDEVAPRVHPDDLDKAERILAAQAADLTLDALRKVIVRAEAYLDPDGVEPKEEELRESASVSVRQDRSGRIHIAAKLDPARAAPVVTAIEALVAEELNAQSDDGARRSRSIGQMQADALVTVFEHYLGCDEKDTPLRGATVIVRVNEKDLVAGSGFGIIDGIDQPVSIGTVRRMAGDGELVGWIMSEGREVLSWGRHKRLFTAAQRRILVERDGGCVGCGAPPGRCRAHHIRWWSRGGRTDLSNGVLVCDGCHHRIHDNGWDVRVDGTGIDAEVWLIPPAGVDPRRTPRPAARRRFDFVPA